MRQKQIFIMDSQQRKNTQKLYRFNKIFQIMSIYIKYLLGEDVDNDEQKEFLEYCKHSVYKGPNQSP